MPNQSIKYAIVITCFAGLLAASAADSLVTDTSHYVPKLFDFRIVTEPDSALVFLDDSLKGVSPCTFSGVTQGDHTVTVRKSGYYLKRAEISVDATLPQELSFVLLKPAFLRVTSDPAGAALYIDGKNAGMTPYENDKIKPGEHALKVELKNHTPAELAVEVKSGGCDTTHFTLELTKAYSDSVETARRTAEKLKKDRFTFTLVSALFSICAILLIVIEANDG